MLGCRDGSAQTFMPESEIRAFSALLKVAVISGAYFQWKESVLPW